MVKAYEDRAWYFKFLRRSYENTEIEIMTRRVPNHIRELSGNPGKRKTKRTVDPVGNAQKPDYLSDYASVVWDRLMLAMPNVYKASDSEILGAYCLAAANFRDAAFHIAIEGAVTSKGRANPWLTIQKEASRTLASLGARLGLDPVARDAVAQPADAAGGSKFAGLINHQETE